MMTTMTNTTLLEGLKVAENHTAWQTYVDRYRPMVVRYAQRRGVAPDDAEDVAQSTLQAFSTAYRDGRYDRERGRLRTWLLGIARNQVLRWHREHDPRHKQMETGFFERVPEVEDPGRDEVWHQEWRSAVLQQCLQEVRNEVRPKTFRAFELFALEERAAADVARELDMTENAVFLAKRNVLRRVRELWPLMADIW